MVVVSLPEASIPGDNPLGDLRSPGLLTTYDSWDDPPTK